jgi:hypothetical protein
MGAAAHRFEVDMHRRRISATRSRASEPPPMPARCEWSPMHDKSSKKTEVHAVDAASSGM